MIPAVLGASAAFADSVVVLVDDPDAVSDRRRRRLEKQLGEVVLAPISHLWQLGRARHGLPEPKGPCHEEAAAVYALGFIAAEDQRAPLLIALLEASSCAEAHGWSAVPPFDCFPPRAASLLATQPELADALPDGAEAILARPRPELPSLVVGWPDGAPPPIVDGLQAELTDGRFLVDACGADLSWSSAGIVGGSQKIAFENGRYHFPFDDARQLARALPPVKPAHLEFAAIYEDLVGRFAVATSEGRLRVWTWEGERFEAARRR